VARSSPDNRKVQILLEPHGSTMSRGVHLDCSRLMPSIEMQALNLDSFIHFKFTIINKCFVNIHFSF